MKIIHSPTGVYVCVLSERDQNKELYLLSNSIKVYSQQYKLCVGKERKMDRERDEFEH